ncbi:SDR family NAD(P)-dependent oxidoreductase [Bacillus testis]|uniref:SDR family NAD(P)-dependent oxidoreductase n=1 Tax=Bacillus testis TaxID=1622072 RepID=UPI00067F0D70|nr:SDR family oxidoreductase [Bacillus testis]
MRLANKIALITGGSSGIGRGICHAFAKEGASIAFVGLNEEKGRKTEQELLDLGCDAFFIRSDLTDRKEVVSIIPKVIGRYGKLDVLVNNAHASKNVPIEETTEDIMDLSLNTGIWATFLLMKNALPYLKETKGKVVNFASGAGMEGLGNQASYAASKEAIRALSRVASNEWGKYGINVNVVCPLADSPGVQEWQDKHPHSYQKMVDLIPMRRLGDSEKDIGKSVVFLASDDASYITGHTLMVDGGAVKAR